MDYVEDPIRDEDPDLHLPDADVTKEKLAKTAKPKLVSLIYQMLAEAVGTTVMVLVGLNALSAAILAKGADGNFQVGLMVGLGIAWGAYTAAPISCGHLNPAITAAVALLRPSSFPWWKLPLYWLSQYFGAWTGAVLTYQMWSPTIRNYESGRNIVRGEPASDVTFALFGAVFPFPAAAGANNWPRDHVSPWLALSVEAIGTAVTCFVMFMALDKRNSALKGKDFAPVLVGLSVTAMITGLSPLTGGSFNPARDGGPRVLAAMVGWGRRAFPGHQNGFWVYFVGPIIGAIAGGVLYDHGLTRAYKGRVVLCETGFDVSPLTVTN